MRDAPSEELFEPPVGDDPTPDHHAALIYGERLACGEIEGTKRRYAIHAVSAGDQTGAGTDGLVIAVAVQDSAHRSAIDRDGPVPMPDNTAVTILGLPDSASVYYWPEKTSIDAEVREVLADIHSAHNSVEADYWRDIPATERFEMGTGWDPFPSSMVAQFLFAETTVEDTTTFDSIRTARVSTPAGPAAYHAMKNAVLGIRIVHTHQYSQYTLSTDYARCTPHGGATFWTVYDPEVIERDYERDPEDIICSHIKTYAARLNALSKAADDAGTQTDSSLADEEEPADEGS